MKTTQSSGTRPVHQTVAGALEFKANGKAIAIAFTDQQLSGHAGSATFWGWLRPRDWAKRLAATFRARARVRLAGPDPSRYRPPVPDDLVSIGQQATGEVKADESGGTGHKNSFHVSLTEAMPFRKPFFANSMTSLRSGTARPSFAAAAQMQPQDEPGQEDADGFARGEQYRPPRLEECETVDGVSQGDQAEGDDEKDAHPLPEVHPAQRGDERDEHENEVVLVRDGGKQDHEGDQERESGEGVAIRPVTGDGPQRGRHKRATDRDVRRRRQQSAVRHADQGFVEDAFQREVGRLEECRPHEDMRPVSRLDVPSVDHHPGKAKQDIAGDRQGDAVPAGHPGVRHDDAGEGRFPGLY